MEGGRKKEEKEVEERENKDKRVKRVKEQNKNIQPCLKQSRDGGEER